MFHNHNFLQAISLGENEDEQARAQEDETRRGYRQKSIRDEVMIAHGTPANSSEFIEVFETNSAASYLIIFHLNYNNSFNSNKQINYLFRPSQVLAWRRSMAALIKLAHR